MKPENLVHLRVWGDFACFTRPEMKVERVSYPIMTPSAARGVLEAVFWEPQMYYLIHQITVLRHTVGGREYGKGKWLSFRRNEVTQTMKTSVAQKWMKVPESFAPIQAGGGAADATQRNTLALADVAYLSQLHNLMDAEQAPPAQFKPACEECSLFKICLPRVTSQPASLRRAAAQLFET